jgi:PDZ domain-containing protein
MKAVLIVRPSTESARVTDTQEPRLVANQSPGPPPVPRAETSREAAERVGLRLPSRRHRWWVVPVVAFAGLLLAAVAAASIVPSDWVASTTNPRTGEEQGTPYALTPGSAQPVDDRIAFGDIEGVAEQYAPDGDVYFVTVTEPAQSVLSWLLGRDHPAVEFHTYEQKYGVQTPQQRRTFSLEMMRTSEQVAQYVALRRLGYDVEVVPGDVLIEAIVCLEANAEGTECVRWSPSDDVLDPGDRILRVDGEEIEGVEDLSRILAGYEAGDVVSMTIARPTSGGGATEIDVEVELTASPDDPERTIVGFYPFDTRRVELPFELDIDTGRIGGPSAGLAFTLTLIAELTEGELTGGGRVAVTGTIQLDGTVGAIGGLRQKASAVAQTGVDVFIVPAAQGEDDIAAAREAAGDEVTIIPVETLDEALAVLADLGGDPIPPGGECAPDLGTC